MQADADAKTAKIAANKGKLDEIRENEKMGDIDELASKVRTMNAHILELDSSIEGNSSKLSNLTAQDSSTQSQIAAAKTKFENFSGSQSLPNLTTRIRSIYPNWGFVTLAAGNSSGVVTNSTLNVVRGGEVIAKLLVTAVEGSSSSASIVPNSIGEDVTLTVGDQVVPGVKETTPAGN